MGGEKHIPIDLRNRYEWRGQKHEGRGLTDESR